MSSEVIELAVPEGYYSIECAHPAVRLVGHLHREVRWQIQLPSNFEEVRNWIRSRTQVNNRRSLGAGSIQNAVDHEFAIDVAGWGRPRRRARGGHGIARFRFADDCWHAPWVSRLHGLYRPS